MSFFQEFFNSGTDEQQSKRRLGALLIAVTAALLAVALIVLMVASIVTAVKNKGSDEDGEGGDVDPSTPPANYTTTTFADTQLYSGSLLLLDETHFYTGSAAMVQSIPNTENRPTVDGTVAGTPIYIVDGYDTINFTVETLAAFNQMMIDFYAAKSADGYAAKALCVEPASSAHSVTTKNIMASGTGVILNDQHMDSTIYDATAKTGKGVYKWIYENAYKYGFVRASAAEGEENVFRYVGAAHAQLMKDKEIATVAEYIEYVKEKGTAHKPVKTTVTLDKDNTVDYHVYYLAVGSEFMFVPVNAEAYTVSGDNVGGYIVTVKASALKEAK